MGHTVLCVDNDRNLCQVIAKALAAEGYEVRTAYDGEKALAAVVDEPPDLVLLDLILPRRDGFSVLEAIRGLPGGVARTPVVLLCGCSPTPEYTRRAESLEAVALLTKPVPLALLVETVSSRLGEPKRAVPRDAEALARERAEAALAGGLDRFAFPALLHHLHGLRASGVLHLQNGKKRKWLQLQDGYPTAVRSNLLNECLGNYLARTGRISEEAMEESARQMGEGRLQGEILVAMDVLSEEEISQALRAHAEEKLLDVFAWKKGRFRFEFDARLQKASGLAKRSPANLVLRGVRERAPLERVDRWLDARRDARLARSQKPFYRFQEIDLDAALRDLVEELDGTRPLSDFMAGDELQRRSLYALLLTGVLELRGGDAVAPEAVSRRSTRTGAPAASEEHLRQAELASMAERFEEESYFEILEVEEEADEAELREAYERLAARAHPDRVHASSGAVKQLATRVFDQVARAYETLADPRKRKQYQLARKKAEREATEGEDGRRALQAEQHFQQGEAALSQRDYENALRLFGRALELNPDEGEYPAHYGWTLHLCHPDDVFMAEEAIEHIKRGIKLAPEREKPYLLLGRLCKAIGRAGAAEKMFTRAVQLQPECVEALRELRLINMRRQRQRGFVGRLLRR